jgi:hypothetical protein
MTLLTTTWANVKELSTASPAQNYAKPTIPSHVNLTKLGRNGSDAKAFALRLRTLRKTQQMLPLEIKKKEDRKSKIGAALALAGLLILVCVALPVKRPAAPSLLESGLIITDIKSAPLEYQIAYRDTGVLPRGTDLTAARIRYLLKSLAEKTGDSYQHIADKTSEATETLKRDYGREVTRQRFLEEANNYYKAGGHQGNYDSVSARLIVGMGK